jgi:hypothetical protein
VTGKKMKLIYNVVKEAKALPKYPATIGSFETNSDAVKVIEEERLKMENVKFNFYVLTVKSETAV